MKIVLGIVASAALALVAFGCSSSSGGGSDGFGPDPDLAAVQSRFDKPDGTFNASNASKVFENGTNGSSSASDLNFGGDSGSGSSSTQSVGLHVLDAANGKPSKFSCSAFQSGQQSGSCACPSGGSVDYVLSSSGAGNSRSALMKFRMNACSSGDSTIDGSEYLDMHTDATDQQHPTFSMLLMVDATITRAGQTKHIDLQARYGNGGAEIAVKVDDGWVVVTVKSSDDGKSGSWSVRDRNGSWTCTMNDSHGTCTSDKGETKTF